MRPLRNLTRRVEIMSDILPTPKASLQSVMTFGLLQENIFKKAHVMTYSRDLTTLLAGLQASLP